MPQGDLSKYAERFAYRIAAGEDVDLEAFLAECPTDARDEVRRRCEEALRVQRALRESASRRFGKDVQDT